MSYITEETRAGLEEKIREAGGNELFFVATFSPEGAIESFRVLARGNGCSVPAIVDSAKHGEVVIHNHPSGDLTPSEPDIHMASVFGNRGVGFFIINNDATELYAVVEPFADNKTTPLDIEGLVGYLEPGGEVSRAVGTGYELREEQLRMLESVGRAYNEGTVSLVEAGTGTGKTFAYLIPSIVWSLQNGERVVISTNTINLQEQLINKDIPLLEKCLPEGEFKYSLVKGMGNYLCLLRAETASDGSGELFESGELGQLSDIVEWSKVTEDGSLSDLSFTPRQEVWDKVRAESESCLRVRCPYYSDCFFYKARREMASADILIANHHLVFSDLSVKGRSDEGDFGILPPYKRIVLDEAHHIEDSATSHFGMGATKYGIIRLLRKLKRKTRKGDVKGLVYYVAAIASKLEKYLRAGILRTVLESTESVVSPRVDGLEELVGEVFDRLYYFSLPIASGTEGGQAELKLRFTERVRETEGWEEVEERFSMLRVKLRDLEGELNSLVELLRDYESEIEVAKVLVEFKGIAGKLRFYSDVIGTFLDPGNDGYVRWIEGREGRGGVLSGIGLSPLDVSEELKEKLYTGCSTVVMTSATLAVNGNFEFLKSRIGLTEEQRVEERLLQSPFNFSEQVLLAIPHDVAEPGARGYAGDVTRVVFDAVKISGGGALVLFTSYGMLEKVYGAAHEELEELGIVCLKQGTLPRWRLLEEFKVVSGSVLFATDSFWEGVDVPGEKLRLVIITRLPFSVPTEPVLEARVEYLERQGLNSFIEYTVPQAVLRFKQGFGRLIRTKSDTGAVVVLDKRVVTKYYGRFFLDSLPDMRVCVDSTEKVLEELRAFF
ncbi:MAG: DEAD/DEAH box helicase [Candidatus Dadabacteria bacterium]|nr:DEAD/DEAH box helicase [Candidatus Dadabacteria bacterium]